MLRNKLLEIACFNPASATIAWKAGADRIELCNDYPKGGITPSSSVILQVKKEVDIPLNVIIRPHGGDFVYSKNEIEEMKNAISFCKEQAINGIVLGALTSGKKIDLSVCRELIRLSENIPVTFHRAIDACNDIDTAMKQLIDLGVKRVLTSGAAVNAIAGIETLSRLQASYGNEIIIMPGGGIRSSNLLQLINTGCFEFHSAAITNDSETADAAEIKMMKAILS